MQVAIRDQNDVEISRQPPMLEAVVQQVRLQGELLFREMSSLVSVSAHDDRGSQFARNQQRLVPKLLRRTCGIDQRDASRATTVTPREHVESQSPLLQQFTQQDDKWRISRASGRDAADAHYRRLESMRSECAAIVKTVATVNPCAIECAQRIQACLSATTVAAAEFDSTGRSCSSVSTVRSVAPCCCRMTSSARWPNRARSASSCRRASIVGVSDCGVTTRRASALRNTLTMSRKFSVEGPTMIGTPNCAASSTLCPPFGTRL